MLQVISKKFFKTEDYYNTNRKVIVYSNMRSFTQIETDIATLEPINTYNGVTTYIMSYDNVLERQKDEHMQLIAIGDFEIVQDFLCCCTFWFKGIFSTDKHNVENLIRKEVENICDIYLPKNIVPNVFESDKNLSKDIADGFNGFIKSLLGLCRNKYLKVIKVIRQYKDALHSINSNLELSYAMFVAAIESLAQNFDNYNTSWEDCPSELTKPLDEILENISEENANKIRDIIIKDTHAKLFRRYQTFALNYLSEFFYKEEALKITNPCKQSQLLNAVKNSYDLRSGYVHVLDEIPKIIKIGGIAEIYTEEGEQYFTFSGLIRFTRHIIWTFIQNQEFIEKEDVDYFSQLPGSVKVKAAPEYWIHKVQYYNNKSAPYYLEGFLEYYLSSIISDKNEFLDLYEICYKIESLVNGLAKSEQKIPMVTFYIIYNLVWDKEKRCVNFEKFINKHEAVTEIPCIENILLHLLTGNELPWSLDDTVKVYKQYDKKRFKRGTTKIPNLFEICIILEMANMAINVDIELYKEMVRKSMYERPGDEFILELVNKIEANEEIDKIDWLNHYLKK